MSRKTPIRVIILKLGGKAIKLTFKKFQEIAGRNYGKTLKEVFAGN